MGFAGLVAIAVVIAAIVLVVRGWDVRLVLLTGFVPSVFGGPLLDATRRELDQRSRLLFLRAGTDKAVSAIDVDFTVLGSEAPLVGAAGISRMALGAETGPTIAD